MRTTYLVATTLAALLATTSSFAADALRAASPAPMTQFDYPATPLGHDWSGFYVGANAGYGWGEYGVKATPIDHKVPLHGFSAGGQIGYNFDVEGMIVGFEADYNITNIDWTGLGVLPTGEIDLKTQLSAYSTLRARLGLPVGNALPYITGGLAFGRVTGDFWHLDEDIQPSNWRRGWTIGAGTEFALTDSVSVKAEYLYANFGDDNLKSNDTFNALHTIRTGLNFSF